MYYDAITAKLGLIIGITLLIIVFVPVIIRNISMIMGSTEDNDDDQEIEEKEESTAIVPYKRKEYPFSFKEFIGQTKTVENLEISIHVAKKNKMTLPHTLLYGLPGLGKTTLAELIAQALGVNFVFIEGVSLDSKDTVLKIINQITEHSIVFIDEIHQVSNRISEIWYKVMENYTIDIVEDTIYTKDVPKFTTIGATTDFGQLLKPFRDRFVHKYELLPYSMDELTSIIKKLSTISNQTATATAEIAQHTPRLAKGYIQAMHEYMLFENKSCITINEFNKLLYLKDINEFGLTNAQMRVLRVLTDTDSKLGKHSLAIASGLSIVDLEELVEPYLITEGYVARTSRGRTITDKGRQLC